jgi:hypothetical protein
MLLVGFGAALRRSELVTLTVGDGARPRDQDPGAPGKTD